MKTILTIFLLFGFLNAMEVDKNEFHSIITTKWLKNNLKDSNLVIVDLRSRDEYLKSHIKNAVNIPGLKFLFDDKFFMPELGFLKKLFSNAGIDSTSKVLAYDNGDFIWAARFYWILEVLGHENVAILNVGFDESLAKELPLDSIEIIAKRKEFIPRINNKKLQTKLSTLMAIGKKTIIDGRKESHYQGKESLAKRFGHIPTAINYACTQNYQVSEQGNKLKDLKELKKLYEDIPKEKEIILYCDGGAEAALNYIVLQELGYKASVYDGSWIEWGNDDAVPINNPSSK